jgi:hypothetical protein
MDAPQGALTARGMFVLDGRASPVSYLSTGGTDGTQRVDATPCPVDEREDHGTTVPSQALICQLSIDLIEITFVGVYPERSVT